MATSHNQKLIIACETMEFVKLCDALACRAMYLGITREGFVSTLVGSWNEVAIKATIAVTAVEDKDKASADPAPATTNKEPGKASNQWKR